MAPTCRERDRIFACRIKSASRIRRGSVVIFLEKTSSDYGIKRVIGLPGEKVKIVNGETYIDGILCAVGRNTKKDSSNYRSDRPLFIHPNTYFLLGDNRGVSDDSRKFGPVSFENIYYKALVVYWPPHHFKILI